MIFLFDYVLIIVRRILFINIRALKRVNGKRHYIYNVNKRQSNVSVWWDN